MILQYKDTQIFYSEEGHGEAVVLLHGFLENSTMWSDLTSQISKSHRVIRIDLLGHGQTGCLGYIHTMESMAEAVDFVLKSLKIDSATFIGHSMGGYVALAYAEMFPAEIKGLCLMNSTSLPDNEGRRLNRDRAIAAVKQNHKTFISMSVSNLFAPKNREQLTDEIELVKKEALKMPLQGIIAALEGMKIRKDRTKLLRDISFKKMMIIGRKDPVLEYDISVELGEKAKMEIVVFPDGHMSHIENKQELSYKIIQFVEK